MQLGNVYLCEFSSKTVKFQLKPARIPRPQRLNVGRGGIAARRILHL